MTKKTTTTILNSDHISPSVSPAVPTEQNDLLPSISPVEQHPLAPTSTPVTVPECLLIPVFPVGRDPIPILPGRSVVFGRSNMCDVILSNPMVSRICAEVQVDPEENGGGAAAHLILNSYTTNVMINGERFTGTDSGFFLRIFKFAFFRGPAGA